MNDSVHVDLELCEMERIPNYCFVGGGRDVREGDEKTSRINGLGAEFDKQRAPSECKNTTKLNMNKSIVL